MSSRTRLIVCVAVTTLALGLAGPAVSQPRPAGQPDSPARPVPPSVTPVDEEYLDRTNSVVQRAFAQADVALGGTFWDVNKRVLVVKVLEGSDPAGVQQAKEAVEVARASAPHALVVYQAVVTSDVRGHEVAARLLTQLLSAASGGQVGGTYYDSSTGRIVVLSGGLTEAAVKDILAAPEVDGFPVDVRPGSVVLQGAAVGQPRVAGPFGAKCARTPGTERLDGGRAGCSAARRAHIESIVSRPSGSGSGAGGSAQP